jgi:hypothetical protein
MPDAEAESARIPPVKIFDRWSETEVHSHAYPTRPAGQIGKGTIKVSVTGDGLKRGGASTSVGGA